MTVSFAATRNLPSASGPIGLSTQRLNQQFFVSEHFTASEGPLNLTLKYTPLQSYDTSVPSTSVLPVYSIRLSEAGVSLYSLAFFAESPVVRQSPRTVIRITIFLFISYSVVFAQNLTNKVTQILLKYFNFADVNF